MGQIKNIKLHIVTDIKNKTESRTSNNNMLQQAVKQAMDMANKMMPGQVKYLVQRGQNWVVPAAMWGGCAATLGLYLTEWKVVTKYIPYYGSKYDHKEPQ